MQALLDRTHSAEHRTIYTLAKLVASGAKTCLACLTVKSAMTVMKAIRTHTHTTPVSWASPSPNRRISLTAGFPTPPETQDCTFLRTFHLPHPPNPNSNRPFETGLFLPARRGLRGLRLHLLFLTLRVHGQQMHRQPAKTPGHLWDVRSNQGRTLSRSHFQSSSLDPTMWKLNVGRLISRPQAP